MTAARKGKGSGIARTNTVHNHLHDHVMEAIKAEIACRNLTYYRIAKEVGISTAALSRFRQPGGTLKTQSFLALLHYLGIDLVNRDGETLGLTRIDGKALAERTQRE